MTLASPALPYGLRDVKLTPIASDGSLGTAVDLPVAQTLSFSEAEEFEELRGDDVVVALRGKGPKVEWELEAGGISLEAWAVLTGGTVQDAGSTPNQTKTFTKLVTDSRPYFQIEGRSINDVDGDTHVKIIKCKVTGSLEGEFADGQFFVTSCDGEGIGNDSDELYVITWNETAAAITAGVNELQMIASDGTGGTFTLTYSGQTTSALAYNVTASAMQTALEALSNIAVDDVLVTSPATGIWYVEFQGTLAETDVAEMTVDDTSLTGGHAAVVTLRAGAAAS